MIFGPDFKQIIFADSHKLETFQPFDRSIILKSDVDVVTYSTEWHNSLNR